MAEPKTKRAGGPICVEHHHDLSRDIRAVMQDLLLAVALQAGDLTPALLREHVAGW